METLTLPEGAQLITPYLILQDAGSFFDFMQTVFDAQEVYKPTLTPDNRIMHGNLHINGSQVMYCDSSNTYPAQPANLFIYVKNCDATYQKALDAGASSVNEPADQNYGRSAGIKDPFGNTWWVTSL